MFHLWLVPHGINIDLIVIPDLWLHSPSIVSAMSASQSSQKLPAQAVPEAKARGANRSTKVAGKLKVLPDQPEPVLPAKKVDVPAPPKVDTVAEESEEEADSDEDGDDEEEPEDVEVRADQRLCGMSACQRHVVHAYSVRCTINSTSYLPVPLDGMPCV